jgi:hypothetical protein
MAFYISFSVGLTMQYGAGGICIVFCACAYGVIMVIPA